MILSNEQLATCLAGGIILLFVFGIHSAIQIRIADEMIAKAKEEANIGKGKDDDDARREDWRSKDKTRSGNFLLHAMYHHAMVKSRTLLHGIGGCVSFILSISLSVWMLITNGEQRGPSILPKVMGMATILMGLGFLTPHMQRKMHKYGKFRYLTYSFLHLTLSLAVCANSIYAQPKITQAEVKACQVWTVLGIVFPLISLVYFAQAMIQRCIWNDRTPAIAFTSCIGYFFAPPLYEVMYGTAELIELYEKTRVGDIVYFLNVTGLLSMLINQMTATLALVKVMSREQVHRLNGYMWIVYGTFITILLLVTLGPSITIGYAMLCGSALPFHWLFPVHDVAENQTKLGLFVGEMGGNNLGIAIKGSQKMGK